MDETYLFTLKPLPYSEDALEPVLSEETIHLHHSVLQQNYVNNLNIILKPHTKYQDWSLNALAAYCDTFPKDIQNSIKKYAGGVFNHELYFDSMTPTGKSPSIEMEQKIINSFGSMDNFKSLFKANAMALYGSGYTWLLQNSACKLQIVNTSNQDTPPLSIVKPLLNIDIWEHSFYLDYKTSRDEYIDKWFTIINWENVEKLASCTTMVN